MTHLMRRTLFPLSVLTALCAVVPLQAQVTTFSAGGYFTPETISLAPAGFGSVGGEYLIPDFGRANAANVRIWAVPTTGGPPTQFVGNFPDSGLPRGGLFLPDTGWGANSGQFLTTAGGASGGDIFTTDSTGATTLYKSQAGSIFGVPLLVPGTFGAHGGQIAITDQTNIGVFLLASDGTLDKLASTSFAAFGEQFAPDGFGSVGGQLLVNNLNGGDIVAIDANGNVTPFANIALKEGQVGLRQMLFAPSGFLPGFNEPLLLVSVSGSNQGGGTLGDIVALDNTGTEVASLRADLGLVKFDPRGLYLLGDGSLLVSDASDPILQITPNAFQQVTPEPGALALLLGLGTAGVGLLRRQRALRLRCSAAGSPASRRA